MHPHHTLSGSRPFLLGALALTTALPLTAQFTTQHFVDTLPGNALRQLRAFDVDNDGDQDLFVNYFDFVSGQFAWYENLDGAGSFSGPNVLRSAPISSAVRDFDLADEDGDGDLDLVYTGYVNGPADGVIVRHFDAGAFGPEEVWSDQYGLFVRWMQMDPWNDNVLDIALHQEFNQPHALYNLGGSFSAPEAIGTPMLGLGPDAMEVGNFSGNLGDVIVWIASRLYMHSLTDDGEGGFFWNTRLIGYSDVEPQATEIDGDGYLDIGLCGTDTIAYYSGLQYTPQQYYTPISLEPAAGPGTFGHVNCDPTTDVYFEQNGEPYVIFNYPTLLAAEREFFPPEAISGLPGNDIRPLLADIDQDGVNDMVLVHGDSLFWYTNDGWDLPVVSLAAFADTLVGTCSEAAYPLTGGLPEGGYYSGDFSDDPYFYPYGASGDNPITYTYTDESGCSASATQNIHVIDSVLVTPLTVTTCPSNDPVQISKLPASAEWVGEQPITADGLLDVSQPYSYPVACFFNDVLGCQAYGYTYVNVLEPSLGYAYVNGSEASTVCTDAGQIEVIFSQANGVEGIVFFDPAAEGPGTYLFIGYGDTTVNGCAINDSLFLEVVAPPDVTLAAFTDTLANSCGNLYTLTGGLPEGGVYYGDGVSGDQFDPSGLTGDVTITYTYTDGNGCAGSASQTIHVIDGISVAPNFVQQCVSDEPIQLAVQPQPEVWFDPIVSSTNVLNTALPFDGSVYCAWTDVTGCQLYGTLIVHLSAYSEGYVMTSGDPVPSQICLGTPAFGITTSQADGNEETIIFDPQIAGVGDYQFVGYAFDDESGCLRNDTLSFSVVTSPQVIVSAFPDTLLSTCIESVYYLPEGSPAGGTWSGQNTGTEGQFYPFGLGGQDVVLTYTYDAGNGCSGADSAMMHVINAPEVYPSADPVYRCVGSDPIQFYTVPSGSIWQGAAITPEGYMDMLAPYDGTINYGYTDVLGCGVNYDIDVLISPYTLGTVTIPDGNDVVCADAPPFLISWSTSDGAGVDSLFDPAVAGPGTWYFTGQGVVVAGPTQCYQDVTDSVIVLAVPEATLDLSGVTLLTNDPQYALTEGLPTGGLYGGDFVDDGLFNPGTAGPGWHLITYTVTNADECSTTVSDSLYVELFNGVSAHSAPAVLRAWPVPAQDILNISLPPNEGMLTLVITDARGRDVSRTTVASGTGRTVQLETGSLANGTYTLFARGLANAAPVRVVIAH